LTEIPEHLLKRSRERRAALGLGGDTPPSQPGGETAGQAAGEASPAPATATPAPAAAATPVPAETRPEPPKPVPAYIQAAQRRRRVPYWAMPVLAGLPLWAYVYVSTLSPPPAENDPLALGEGVYTNSGCSGCHGADGAGSASIPGFTDGLVVEIWEDYRDQMAWVRLGEDGFPGDTYGNNDQPKVGATMPAHPGLTDQELAQVTLYERRVLGGEEAPAPAEDVLFQIANGDVTFAQVLEEEGVGPLSDEAGITAEDISTG
jgi:mono/diheme cytochrome c family protein